MSIILDTRGGIGDNIYARPFVRAYAAAYNAITVRTPWPQLFADLPVTFQMPGAMPFRTQRKNMQRTIPRMWGPAHVKGAEVKRFVYRLEVPRRTILGELESIAGWPDGQPFIFDLPTFAQTVHPPEPFALLRPVTLRKEWPNRARSPDARYIARAAELLRDVGYHVVLVADIDPRHEPAIEPLPVGDTSYIHGELDAEAVLALVQRASVVVGGVGWIVPAAMAYGTPAVFIGGGNGGHNAPELVTDPRVDCSRMRFILPDHYCRCINMRHGCNKVIRSFDERFTTALNEVAPTMERAA